MKTEHQNNQIGCAFSSASSVPFVKYIHTHTFSISFTEIAKTQVKITNCWIGWFVSTYQIALVYTCIKQVKEVIAIYYMIRLASQPQNS